MFLWTFPNSLVFRRKDLCEVKHDVGVEKIWGEKKCLKMAQFTLSSVGGGVKQTEGKVD